MKKGFSLVELSIVLVILGLLVGGVLTGQSLIRAAQLRAITTEYNQYVTAIRTFQDKYFALPGDMRNATQFWNRLQTTAGCNTNSSAPVASPGACDGDGDGAIERGTASNVAEAFSFWQHLANAGLIEGAYSPLAGSGGGGDGEIGINSPRSKISNTGWSAESLGTPAISSTTAFEGSYGNVLYFGTETTSFPNYGTGEITPEEMWNIDTKLDDGRPGVGFVRTFESYTNCHDQASSSSTPLANIAQYRLTNANAACGIIFSIR